MSGGIEVQPHDVAHFLDEQRIFRQLEGLAAMGLQREGPPDPANRRLREPARLRHRSRAPMGGLLRRALQCHRNHPFHVSIGDLSGSTGPRLIQQPVEPLLQEAGAPSAHSLTRDPHLRGYVGVRHSGRTGQDDTGPLGQRLRRLGSARPSFEGLALSGRERESRHRSSSAHRCPPFYTEYAEVRYLVP